MCAAVSRVNSSTHSPTFHIIFAPPYGRQAVSRLVALPHLSGQKVQKKDIRILLSLNAMIWTFRTTFSKNLQFIASGFLVWSYFGKLLFTTFCRRFIKKLANDSSESSFCFAAICGSAFGKILNFLTKFNRFWNRRRKKTINRNPKCLSFPKVSWSLCITIPQRVGSILRMLSTNELGWKVWIAKGKKAQK